jgi:hypothetical protein
MGATWSVPYVEERRVLSVLTESTLACASIFALGAYWLPHKNDGLKMAAVIGLPAALLTHARLFEGISSATKSSPSLSLNSRPVRLKQALQCCGTGAAWGFVFASSWGIMQQIRRWQGNERLFLATWDFTLFFGLGAAFLGAVYCVPWGLTMMMSHQFTRFLKVAQRSREWRDFCEWYSQPFILWQFDPSM